MKNPSRKLIGILCLVGTTLLSTVMMYICSYVIQIGHLYDYEMARSLLLPIIMLIPAVIIYLIWFSDKAKKFTNGTYPDYSDKYYQSVLFLILTFVVQYLLGFLVTLPLFSFYLEVSVPLLLSLILSEIFLMIGNALCFFVFRPIADSTRD